jgi:hypothetical protein
VASKVEAVVRFFITLIMCFRHEVSVEIIIFVFMVLYRPGTGPVQEI